MWPYSVTVGEMQSGPQGEMSSGQKLCFRLHGPNAEDTVRYQHPHPRLLGHRHLGELSYPLQQLEGTKLSPSSS